MGLFDDDHLFGLVARGGVESVKIDSAAANGALAVFAVPAKAVNTFFHCEGTHQLAADVVDADGSGFAGFDVHIDGRAATQLKGVGVGVFSA